LSDILHSRDQEAKPARPNGARPDWTVAIYLGAYTEVDGDRGNIGAEDKLNQLHELAEKTKDGHVAIVVEALVRKGDDPLHPVIPKQGDKAGPYDCVQILMENGEEKIVSRKPSERFKDDLGEFANLAESQLSKHIAYVIESHGGGTTGFAAGSPDTNGIVTLADFDEVLGDAMKKSGRGKADMIDLDLCYGGQWGVVKAMSGVSKQLVASELKEYTMAFEDGTTVNGQHLNAWISKLTSDPEQNGYQLANLIVEEAKQGENRSYLEGTPTLAHFDLEGHEKEFQRELDKFGSALNSAMIVGNNQQVVASCVDSVPNVEAHEDIPDAAAKAQNYKADLGTFVQNIMAKVETGQIVDNRSHDLAQAAEEMNRYLSDRGKLIADLYIGSQKLQDEDKEVLQSQTFGLSVFMVDANSRDNPSVPPQYLDAVKDLEASGNYHGWQKFVSSLETTQRPSIF